MHERAPTEVRLGNLDLFALEKTKWHTCEDHAWQSCNNASNCYAYALDRPDYFWCIPGLGYAQTQVLHFFSSYDRVFAGFTKDEHRECLTKGAEADGLIPIEQPRQTENHYSVALFFSDANDFGFHWYRQDSDGTWSHKNGWRPPTNLDRLGRIISDPRRDEDSGYPIFGGFFLVPRDEVQLRSKFPLI